MIRRLLAIRLARQLLALAVTFAVLVATASLAEACPNCKKALASGSGGEGGDLVRGYMWSILFMLSTPFVVLGSVSTYFYMLVRKARKNPRPLTPAQAAAQRSLSTTSDA